MSRSPNHRLLSTLHLSAEELKSLTQEGFVAPEMRGTQRYYKLRFRIGGKQRVRYLGSSSAFASGVAGELYELQANKRTLRELDRGARQINAALRASQCLLAPILIPLGFHFHGLRVRKQRTTNKQSVDHTFTQVT